jgi:predicted AAA+ superfamily ATPase
MNLDALFTLQQNAIRRAIKPVYRRINLDQGQHDSQPVAILGPPGSGKTTALLQRARELPSKKRECLYVRSDHLALYGWPIEEVASSFYDHGGKTLLIDDLHKCPNGSEGLAQIFEQCPGLTVVFSAPTEPKLPENIRRHAAHRMSFREYIAMVEKQELPKIPFEHILRFHRRLVEDINGRLTILPLFKNYLRGGCLPATAISPRSRIREEVLDIVNKTIEQDVCALHGYTSGHAQQLKQIVSFIAQHAPGRINVSSVARKMSLGRDTIKRYLHDLEDARLITMLYKRGNKPTLYSKPDKVFLHNTNLCHALQHRPETHALAETFLVNQLQNAGNSVHVPHSRNNVIVNHTYTIEVVRRGKKRKERLPRNHYQAVTNVTAGSLSRIPLWLFGFMY